MTTPQVTTRMNPANRQTKRKAFTLVELMIVIVIIGILVGISAPFIFGAMISAKEFTIQNEIMQLDAAVTKFKTEHGFYPPAIGQGMEVDTPAKFRRYLNRIAPNHAEGTGAAGDGLQIWWRDVGSQLDPESSLVFWLSGLCTSKQYPLSGSAAIISGDRALAAHNVNKYFDHGESEADPGFTIDRNVFFEFNSAQVVQSTNTAGAAEIKAYNQPNGKGDSLAYRYRDSKSYVPTAGNAGIAYHTQTASDAPVNFYNPDTFQIIGPGMDGKITDQTDPDLSPVTNTLILSKPMAGADVAQDDNITNFSGGRLDLVFE